MYPLKPFIVKQKIRQSFEQLSLGVKFMSNHSGKLFAGTAAISTTYIGINQYNQYNKDPLKKFGDFKPLKFSVDKKEFFTFDLSYSCKLFQQNFNQTLSQFELQPKNIYLAIGTSNVGKSTAFQFYANSLKKNKQFVQRYELDKDSLIDKQYLKDLFNGTSSFPQIRDAIQSQQEKTGKTFTIIFDGIEKIMNSPNKTAFFNICRYLRDINVRIVMISSQSDIGFDIYKQSGYKHALEEMKFEPLKKSNFNEFMKIYSLKFNVDYTQICRLKSKWQNYQSFENQKEICSAKQLNTLEQYNFLLPYANKYYQCELNHKSGDYKQIQQDCADELKLKIAKKFESFVNVLRMNAIITEKIINNEKKYVLFENQQEGSFEIAAIIQSLKNGRNQQQKEKNLPLVEKFLQESQNLEIIEPVPEVKGEFAFVLPIYASFFDQLLK